MPWCVCSGCVSALVTDNTWWYKFVVSVVVCCNCSECYLFLHSSAHLVYSPPILVMWFILLYILIPVPEGNIKYVIKALYN